MSDPRRSAPAIASGVTDQYVPIARIGSGGQAEILLAVQRGSGSFEKLVVIKRLWPHLAGDEESRRRLEQEARLVARLHHPNVCQVLNLIENDDGPLLVLEYLDGVTLEQVSTALPRPRTRDDIRLIAGILQQACEGLHSAHTMRDRDGTPAKLVHRDVSSGNVIITREGIVKVLDFGIAKASTSDDSRIASVRGTVPFMSPEQVQGMELDHRSDVFSLGVLAYEALTGLGLYRRGNLPDTFQAILEETPPPIGIHQPEVPPDLETVVRRALEKDRAARPPSARELGNAIAASVSPLGGAMGLSQIAEVVETRFADTLTERIRQFDSIRHQSHAASPRIAHWTRETFFELPRVDMSPVSLLSQSTMNLAPMPVTPAPSPPPVPTLTATPPPVPAGRGSPDVDTLPAQRRRGTIVALAALFVIAAIIATTIIVLPDAAPPAGAPPAVAAAPAVSDPASDLRDAAIHVDAAVVPAPAPAPAIVDASPEPLRPAPPATRTAKQRTPATPRSRRPTPQPTAPRAAPGFLTVDSRPAARISVDGRSLGQVPLYRIALPPGKHVMTATLEDGRKKTYTLEIKSGEDLRRRLTW